MNRKWIPSTWVPLIEQRTAFIFCIESSAIDLYVSWMHFIVQANVIFFFVNANIILIFVVVWIFYLFISFNTHTHTIYAWVVDRSFLSLFFSHRIYVLCWPFCLTRSNARTNSTKCEKDGFYWTDVRLPQSKTKKTKNKMHRNRLLFALSTIRWGIFRCECCYVYAFI